MKKKYLEFSIDENYVKHFNVNPQGLNKEELQEAIRQMSKTANQRLRQLEKYGFTELNAYRKVLRNAEKMTIFDYTKKGEIKFSGAVKSKSYNQLEQEFAELQRFLTAKTSTIKGIKEKYEKATKKVNEEYSVNLTTQQIGELFESEIIQNISNRFGSDKVLTIISRYNISDLPSEEIIALFENATSGRKNQSFNDLIQRFNNQKEKVEELRSKFRSN